MTRLQALWHRWKAPALFLAITVVALLPQFFDGMTWEGF